jgi:carboxypeptidase Q
MEYNLTRSPIKIAIGAITVEDAEMFVRMQKRKQRITVRLNLQPQFVENANSNNLVFELRGKTLPNQIVLAGGHIDTWDTGSQTGANDDGGGFITVFEALRLLKKSGFVPQRTIRFIAWSGEELGSPRDGAAQYVEAHQSEIGKHVAAFESDYGSTKLVGFAHRGTPASKTIVKGILNQYMSILNASEYSEDVFTADI